ncbi:MAG: pilus assembly protein [Sphingomonas sp.]
MIASVRRFRDFSRSLRECTSGLALTEFAFSVPILLTLGLFGLETANFAMAHLRISNIATMTADNAARIRDSIDEADIVELFTGAKMTGTGINFAQNGRIILSDLEQTPTGGNQWIRWQRCDGALSYTNPETRWRPRTAGGAAITNGTEIYLADRQTFNTSTPSSPAATPTFASMGTGTTIAAAPSTAVMVVEVVYNYQPIIPNSFLSGRQIRYQSAFNVRQRTDQALRNLGRITPRSCNTFAA